MAAGLAAAANIRRLAPRFPRRGSAADSTPTAAWARPATGPLLPRLLRCSLATVTGDDDSHGYEDVPRSWYDPEAPPVPGFEYDDKDLASEESMWELYERWCDYHGVKRAREDMLRRFGAFKDRARRIHEFNLSGASFTKRLNKFGDQTQEERANFFTGRCRSKLLQNAKMK